MSMRVRFVALVAALVALMIFAAVLVPRFGEMSVRDQLVAERRDVAEHAMRAAWSEATGRLERAQPLLELALAKPSRSATETLLQRALDNAQASRAWLISPSQADTVDVGNGRHLREVASMQALIRAARAGGRASGLIIDGGRGAWVHLAGMPANGTVAGIELSLDSGLARRMVDGYGMEMIMAGLRTIDGKALPLGSFADESARAALTGSLSSLGRAKRVESEAPGGPVRVLLLDVYEGGSLLAAVRPVSDSSVGWLGEPQWLLMLVLGLIASAGLVASAWFGGKLQSLFQRLDRAAHEAIEARGEYQPVVCDWRGEVGEFVRIFNLMNESARQREQRIRQLAYRDPVTKLPTRVLFDERAGSMLKQVMACEQMASLLLIQVDDLRDIGDTLGRQAVEQVLAELAERFRSVLRGTRMLERRKGAEIQDASVLARTGAYEFSVMLRECDPDTARKVGLRLADMAAKRFRYEGQTLSVSVRIGVAAYPEHGAGIPDLMQSADFAVVGAADQLGGVAVFDPVFESEREKQLAMQAELREALEQRQLHMVFQPKVALDGDATLMAEALMRWVHPERGPQNPAEFVGFAEKTGFISKMTQWAIEGSLRHASEWQRQGMAMSISVNLSRRDLTSPDFPTQVIRALRQYGLPGSALTFEISESVIVGAPAIVRRNIELLDRVGVLIAVDNFGSGFGALELLATLPLHALKIDRRYINRMCEDESAAIVVRSAIDLARSLGIKSVAEGVESAEQLAMLRQMKCDQVQGYYLGRPLTRDDFEVWVRHQAEKFGVQGAARELRPAVSSGTTTESPESGAPPTSVEASASEASDDPAGQSDPFSIPEFASLPDPNAPHP